MSGEYPRFAVGVVRGIESTYQVDWMGPDDAQLVDESGDLVTEFCSVREGGFISTDDLLDQAADIVVDWDAED